MQVNQDDRISPSSPSSSGNNLALVIVAIVVIAVASFFFFSSDDEQSAPEPVEPTPIQLPEIAPEQPIEQQPIEEVIEPVDEVVPLGEPEVDEPQITEPQEPELPALSESDDFLAQKTVEVADGMDIAPLLLKKDLARQFVVFVDNLAQGELIRKASPLKGPERQFIVSDVTNKTYLNPDSYRRYDVYADFISELDPQTLVATYKQITPLFNDAFDELGYGDQLSFDERLQQAFSQMLDAPIIEDPIELSTISVNYEFVDPNLEALPNAQKLMIRMGPENTRKIKQAIRTLRSQLN
ncbi:DUF3014 domain-containing protein [Shewanella sp. WXL01]|uniref:DUF3014 domain-containing protein n=1 Tax=Shewanella maritima TaxID=2520507 RepID=A0A411PJ35_9GAMM|nr:MULTISPECIES: DUF3014 domain-containing protein [Shewanella]NKF52170.1 DUF3014 domain-containing protein [Shewanella sp. WXL01]QBF83432.1 DUF3014 domain-containing protein [Shewanella maritima]